MDKQLILVQLVMYWIYTNKLMAKETSSIYINKELSISFFMIKQLINKKFILWFQLET